MPVPDATLPIDREESYPLVVVGGGLAGTCAAIAAARRGMRVALVQDRPVLGGNSSSEVRVHPVGASYHGYLRDARETGLIEELFLEVRARTYGLRQVNGRHYPMWDVILAEKAEAEPTLTLFLNTRVVSVETEAVDDDGYTTLITGLIALQTSTEAVTRLRCDVVIDATGDGTVALPAGAPFRYGREARAEFGESYAPAVADDLVLGSTIMFAARDVGRSVPFAPPAWAHVFPDEESLPFRDHSQLESGYWWLEWGGRLNTIADSETIRRELHAAIFGVWDHIKNRCTVPGVRERAATWAIDWIGHLPGKRESRRFEGDIILTEHDILAGMGRLPADVVAYGGWPIDTHPPDGVYSPDHPCHNPPLPGIYGIPLRSLYSRTIANLMLAGRDISLSHIAHASTRVMKTCAVIGQASGTAAALCVERGLTPRALASQPHAVADVQQALLRDGAYLPLVRNNDPCDLAQQPGVRATATSEATLTLDADDAANPSGWEHAGLSTLESANLNTTDLSHGGVATAGRAVSLDQPLGQAVVLSAATLDAVTLRLVSAAGAPVVARLRIRPARHLRDFGLRDDADLVLEARVPPGETAVEFRPAIPVPVQPNHPVALVLESLPDVAWRLSAQEPPGTQAARWDAEADHWRWLHGTLVTEVSPVSRPYGAVNVLSGVTRPEVGANMWISDPHQPLPQAVTLTWPAPVAVGCVELTFDSELSGWLWEGTVPLLARDYTVEYLPAHGKAWQPWAQVEGNYQRQRAHRRPARPTRALRVTITATHGGRTARLVEVRAYAAC